MSRTIHGDSHTKLYQVWRDMKGRCTNPNCNNYHKYGGRGISFSKEWEDWSTFKQDLLTVGWKEGLWVDRIDPNGDYCKDNVRVVTPQQSLYNRSSRQGKSIYKGVGFFKPTRCWRARICKEGKVYNLGYFKNEKDAALAYDAKAIELYKEYAYLNFKENK